MNRAGVTPNKTLPKDGGSDESGRATKSGRKVKRPAHFDDSPDAKKAGFALSVKDDVGSPRQREVPEAAKKSARKTIGKSQDETPGKTVEPEQEMTKKSSRKTINRGEAEESMKTSRRTILKSQETTPGKEASPEPEVAKKSARKTLLKSAVKNASVEQDEMPKKKPEPESPPAKKSARKDEPEEDVPAGTGISRTGRKIKVPAHLKEFDEVVVASPKKDLPEKSASRKSMASALKRQEPVSEGKTSSKTPARGRSLAAPLRGTEEKKPVDEKVTSKTPSRRTKLFVPSEDELLDPLAIPLRARARDLSPEPVKEKLPAKTPKREKLQPAESVKSPPKEEKLPAKTPSRRGKSLAPESVKTPPKEEKVPTKTPSKRGKSLAPVFQDSQDGAPKTPKIAKAVEDSAEPISRSGRKIKPKKFFGEFEEEEIVPILPKVASPVKTVAKSSPVVKKDSQKKGSPVVKKDSPQKKVSPVVRKDSPQKKVSPVVKKDSPQKKVSPVKRLATSPKEAEKTGASPSKKAKLDANLDKASKANKISPNTEDRQITKRGVNDHHQSTNRESIEKDPLSTSSEDSLSTEQSSVETIFHVEPPKREATVDSKLSKEPEQKTKAAEEEKPKRGRKTLPASTSSEEDASKAPKTPSSRRMTTAPSITPAAPEDVGSSRSGRKIKPKKFFGEEEAAAAAIIASASKVKPATTNGTGRRKTLVKMEKAAEPEKVDEQKENPEAKEAPLAEQHVDEVPEVPSREEILAVVGAAESASADKVLPEQKSQVVQPASEEQDEVIAIEERAEPIQGTGEEPAETVDLLNAESTQTSTDDNAADEPAETAEPLNAESTQTSTDDNAEDESPVEALLADKEEQETSAEALEEDENMQEDESVECAKEENFQAVRIEQTSPPPHPTEEVPNDPAPLLEDDPRTDSSKPEMETEAEIAGADEALLIEDSNHADDDVVVISEESNPPEETDASEATEKLTAAEPEHVEEQSVEEQSVEEQSVEEQSVEENPAIATESIEEPSAVEAELVEDEPTVEEHPFQQFAKPASVSEPSELIAEPSESITESSESGTEAVSNVPQSNDSVKEGHQQAELSASSSFSEALVVEEEAPESVVEEEKKDDLFESVEFLEQSAEGSIFREQALEDVALPESSVNNEQSKVSEEEQAVTPDIEDELDKTEPPEMMDQTDDDKEDGVLEDTANPNEGSFAEKDRDNESVIVHPETPNHQKPTAEELELVEKLPLPHSSHTTMALVEIREVPILAKELTPATPKTPESKISRINETCSPDKPDDQEQASVPPEIIEITDSPIVILMQPGEDDQSESATSTPLNSLKKLTVKERLIQNSRKRSLSVSDAEIVKKNVTFHSPANSTILVDTIDERLKKSFKPESATKPGSNPRKRSLSEHRELGHEVIIDDVKPAKISKLPNFNRIHQHQFSRMESIQDYHNRKLQRSKEMLVNSASKSPAAAALAKNERAAIKKSSPAIPPKSPHKTGFSAGYLTKSPHKIGYGTNHPSSASKPAAARTLITKPLTDAERAEKRQNQFQAAFKPKTGATGTDRDTPDGTHRIVEQSRHKQSQILKGVRTNKRFELLMKFRDAHPE